MEVVNKIILTSCVTIYAINDMHIMYSQCVSKLKNQFHPND